MSLLKSHHFINGMTTLSLPIIASNQLLVDAGWRAVIFCSDLMDWFVGCQTCPWDSWEKIYLIKHFFIIQMLPKCHHHHHQIEHNIWQAVCCMKLKICIWIMDLCLDEWLSIEVKFRQIDLRQRQLRTMFSQILISYRGFSYHRFDWGKLNIQNRSIIEHTYSFGDTKGFSCAKL